MSVRLRMITNSLLAMLVINVISMAIGFLIFRTVVDPYVNVYIGKHTGDIAARYFLVGGIVVLVLTGIGSLWIIGVAVSHLTNPLNRLKRAASEIRDGNLGYELVVSGHDEFSELSVCFEQMRIRLKDSMRMQERSETERRAMMASITHDLKTPITSIIGYAEGIIDGVANTPEKTVEYATVICRKAKSLQALADDLSLLSRLENAQLPLDKQKEDLGAWVAEMTSEFIHSEPDVYIETHLESGLVALIDKEKMSRVLANIFQNSCKYKKPGQTEAKLTLMLNKQDGNALLTVSDDGMGITQDDLPYVFDRFYRADASRGRQSGSGLGLSIARQLIQLHGGKIWIINNAGGGISVNILLPI